MSKQLKQKKMEKAVQYLSQNLTQAEKKIEEARKAAETTTLKYMAEWRMEDGLIHEFIKRDLTTVLSRKTDEEVLEALNHFVSHHTKAIMNGWYLPTSTSMFANCVSVCEQQAASKIVEICKHALELLNN